MDAGKRNINDLFNRSRILEIPHFQRSYVWKEEQWERFLDDIIYISKMRESYFMGPIILKQQGTASSYQTGDVRSVVDGQQRLTTIMLFFKAVYKKNGCPERFSEVFKTHDGELILVHNYSDRKVFEKILLDQNISEKEKEKPIYRCYNYFLENIEKNQIDPNRLLENLLFVGIDLNPQEDEQQIFDTINSLGVALTTAELLKNYLFKEDIEGYNQNWRDVFEKTDEIKKYWDQEVTMGRIKRSNIDLFLQSYLIIKINQKDIKVSSEDKEKYFKIESVFNSYKDFIKKYNLDKSKIISEIKEYAEIYKEGINPKIADSDFSRDDYFSRLNAVIFVLDTSTIIPYVLYLLKKVQNLNERGKIFQYLETYLMRRIVCHTTNKNYNQLFRSFINNEINSLDKLKEAIESWSEVINHMPNDEEIKKGFNETYLTNQQAKGVLYLIEKTIRSDLNSTELKFISEYSLEHVMPKKWRNNWNKPKLSENDEKERDRIILTLGNLTIITKKLNSSISDTDWETKKKGKGKHKGLNEYSNGIDIFQRFLQEWVWDESTIKRRAEELSNFAVNNVWSLEIGIIKE